MKNWNGFKSCFSAVLILEREKRNVHILFAYVFHGSRSKDMFFLRDQNKFIDFVAGKTDVSTLLLSHLNFLRN